MVNLRTDILGGIKLENFFRTLLDEMKTTIFVPIEDLLKEIRKQTDDFFNSVGGEFEDGGNIHKMIHDMPNIIAEVFKLDELADAINEIFKLMFTILTGFIPFLGVPIINLFKSAFGWAFDPINYIFSSGYNFFISGCYVCILIQTFGIFLELYSIARIIAG